MGNSFTTSPAPVTSRYSSLAEWQAFAGQMNILIYSDKDGSGVENLPAIQSAMSYADDQIDLYFSGFYVTPLVFNSGSVIPTVQYWATILGIGRFLYFARGLQDNDKLGDKFRKLVADVYKDMSNYRGGLTNLPCQLAGNSSGVIAAVSPTVDPQGFPVRPPGTIGPYFNGLFWGW